MRVFLICVTIISLGAAELPEFTRGEKYFFARKYELAEGFLRTTLEKQPEHPRASSYLGDIQLARSDYQSALRSYRRALEVSPEPAKEHFRMGQVYIRLKDGPSARSSFESAYSQDPSFKPSLYQLGYVALVFERNKAETIDKWTRFTEEAPQDPQRPKILAVLKLLRDPGFELPPPGSDLSLEEVLALGGKAIRPESVKPDDKAAGHEKSKENNKTEELLQDDSL